jgi:hypothetical protein
MGIQVVGGQCTREPIPQVFRFVTAGAKIIAGVAEIILADCELFRPIRGGSDHAYRNDVCPRAFAAMRRSCCAISALPPRGAP